MFEAFDLSRQLTPPESDTPSRWRLPALFAPKGRPALSYYDAPDRWRLQGEHVLLEAASRGQEFVLDTSQSPGAVEWAAALFGER